MNNVPLFPLSGYYRWQRTADAKRQKDAELLDAIKRCFKGSRGTYGSPRITADLKASGVCAGRHRVARVMRENGIKAKSKRKIRRRVHAKPARFRQLPDLVERKFNPAEANRIWCSDMTFIRTREGFLYLAVVMDLYSRKIIGWAMSERQTSAVTRRALTAAYRNRRPGKGVIHHSDQGSQYANHEYHTLLQKCGMHQSVGRRKTCYDNAVVESFFHTLKMECLYWQIIQTRDEARALTFDYIERFYNTKRRHSTLGYKSPVDYEKEEGLT